MDADDLWLDAIFDEVLIHELSGECLADVIVFGGTSCNETASRFAFPLTFSKESRPGGNEVIWKSPVHFCAHLYRVDLLGHYNIRFTSGLKYAEDKIFNQQCLFLADRVQYMSRLMHLHRQNSASAMSKVLTYSPIDYYTPIINGWISSDQFINSYVSETGKTSTAGYVLAGIYFLDMAADHYKRWKSPQELASVKSHPHYHLFENMAENCVSPQQYKNHHLLLHHPLLFKWKYNAIGAVEYLARKILHIRPIYSFWQKKKYPLSSLPDIK